MRNKMFGDELDDVIVVCERQRIAVQCMTRLRSRHVGVCIVAVVAHRLRQKGICAHILSFLQSITPFEIPGFRLLGTHH